MVTLLSRSGRGALAKVVPWFLSSLKAGLPSVSGICRFTLSPSCHVPLPTALHRFHCQLAPSCGHQAGLLESPLAPLPSPTPTRCSILLRPRFPGSGHITPFSWLASCSCRSLLRLWSPCQRFACPTFPAPFQLVPRGFPPWNLLAPARFSR